MQLSGLHLLLTYQCTLECDHCFVWGSPWQSGTFTIEQIWQVLQQAKATGSIKWIYFEGGEPFLYYPVLLKGVEMASQMGFRVGIVSNGYWARSISDAQEWLRPFSELLEDLSISSDLYHWSEELSQLAKNACAAAEELNISAGVICVAQPEAINASQTIGMLPPGESGVMFRGRATTKLVDRTSLKPWHQFTECPHEDLSEPGRVHLDPLGNLHICQGITIGNIFETELSELCAQYQPSSHLICAPLLRGGPTALVEEYALPHAEAYADACHLCYQARCALRERFPSLLKPDQMYGVFDK